MEGNIAATYTLVYRFLKQQSQHKAAKAVKKAAKPVVVLRDDIEQEGPPLEDIIKEWKTKESTKSGDADSSSEDSDSSDDSSSDSEDSSNSDPSSEDTSGSESKENDTSGSGDSSDESDNLDEAATAKKLPQKTAERDTSATLSSENVREVVKQAAQIPKQQSTKDKNKGSESDSSDSDSDSSSDSSDAESSASSSSSSSSSDSSDEDDVNKVPSDRTKAPEDKSPSTSESSSESEDESDSESQPREDTRAVKKRKISTSGAAVITAVATGSQKNARASQRNEKPPPKVKERFQRVKVQDLAPEQLLNNGYEARGGAANDYGERAHRDLIATRGAGFRKEKNKKKRGSYRGGEITMDNRSIKFDF